MLSRRRSLLLPALATLAAVAVAGWAIRDYRTWMALGPGGLPSTIGGWTRTTRLRLQARDPRSTKRIAPHVGEPGDLKTLEHLGPRLGLRPRTNSQPIPQRQLDQLPDAPLRELLRALFDAKVIEHAPRLHYANSHFEKHNQAITLAVVDGNDPLRGGSNGEIGHVHPSDGSMHMILSPSDAMQAMRMGWAERHALAGIGFGLPPSYLLVYAPQREENLAAIEHLLDAAIRYLTQTIERPIYSFARSGVEKRH